MRSHSVLKLKILTIKESMQINYETEGDKLQILFRQGETKNSRNICPDITLDCDQDGNVISVAIAQATKFVQNPQAIADSAKQKSP